MRHALLAAALALASCSRPEPAEPTPTAAPDAPPAARPQPPPPVVNVIDCFHAPPGKPPAGPASLPVTA